MSRTPSNMIPLGTTAQDFNLVDTLSNEKLSLREIKGEVATVIFFICNHCPFVIHVNSELVDLANTYMVKGVSFVGISSNDINNYPQDAPEMMKAVGRDLKYPFPYLFDETQEVARKYGAACTPDIYVFNTELKLVYRGQLDDSRPGNRIKVTGIDLRYALDCEITGKKNLRIQKPSIGCNIKWK